MEVVAAGDWAWGVVFTAREMTLRQEQPLLWGMLARRRVVRSLLRGRLRFAVVRVQVCRRTDPHQGLGRIVIQELLRTSKGEVGFYGSFIRVDDGFGLWVPVLAFFLIGRGFPHTIGENNDAFGAGFAAFTLSDRILHAVPKNHIPIVPWLAVSDHEHFTLHAAHIRPINV